MKTNIDFSKIQPEMLATVQITAIAIVWYYYTPCNLLHLAIQFASHVPVLRNIDIIVFPCECFFPNSLVLQ